MGNISPLLFYAELFLCTHAEINFQQNFNRNKNDNLLQHVNYSLVKFIKGHWYFFDKKLGKLYDKSVPLLSCEHINGLGKVVCPNNHLAGSGTETAINYKILLYVMSFLWEEIWQYCTDCWFLPSTIEKYSCCILVHVLMYLWTQARPDYHSQTKKEASHTEASVFLPIVGYSTCSEKHYRKSQKPKYLE